jgi:hypothetical protein
MWSILTVILVCSKYLGRTLVFFCGCFFENAYKIYHAVYCCIYVLFLFMYMILLYLLLLFCVWSSERFGLYWVSGMLKGFI